MLIYTLLASQFVLFSSNMVKASLSQADHVPATDASALLQRCAELGDVSALIDQCGIDDIQTVDPEIARAFHDSMREFGLSMKRATDFIAKLIGDGVNPEGGVNDDKAVGCCEKETL